MKKVKIKNKTVENQRQVDSVPRGDLRIDFQVLGLNIKSLRTLGKGEVMIQLLSKGERKAEAAKTLDHIRGTGRRRDA